MHVIWGGGYMQRMKWSPCHHLQVVSLYVCVWECGRARERERGERERARARAHHASRHLDRTLGCSLGFRV
jgi:hypothetical protein